jgi:hypothetical protein
MAIQEGSGRCWRVPRPVASGMTAQKSLFNMFDRPGSAVRFMAEGHSEGGKEGSQSNNDQIVAMQTQQANQAKAANEQRNAWLNYGKDLITGIFEGRPSGASMLDLSGITQGATTTPTHTGSFNPVMSEWLAKNPWYDQTQLTQYGRGNLPQGYSWGVAPDTGSGTTYAIYDPSGAMVSSANI